MHTLIDFMTHVKGVEYVISVMAITGYVLYAEILKPKPFKSLKQSASEDMRHMRSEGARSVLRTAGRLAAAPFIGLAYVIALPFVFAYTLGAELTGMAAQAFGKAIGMAGRTASFGWRPVEAYLGGRKDKKDKKATKKDKAEAGEKEAEKP
ncbi:MAG TPA: hypothetical protein VH866_11325 [Candidatus Deferrimicrobiaceae bacterium]|jgi:hypothetical protein